MAKKRKSGNFKIEQEELKPITIGYFESRRKSSFGIFIILSLFVLVVIFLPEISKYINDYIASKQPAVDTGYKPNTPMDPPTPDVDLEKIFYPYSSELIISDNNINLNNFVLDEETKTLSFEVSNKSNKSLLDLNYYLELYNGEHTLLERIKLAGKDNVFSGEAKTLVKNISDDALNLVDFGLTELEVNEYPNINLNADSEGKSMLVCSNNHEVVTYNFENNLLKSLVSEVSYNNLEENYESIKQEYKALLNNYNVNPGISATFFESLDDFNIVTNVNLSSASRMYIFNADTFSLDTEAKIVSFEMEAQGFTCY